MLIGWYGLHRPVVGIVHSNYTFWYYCLIQMGNHDQWRAVSRFRGPRQGDLLNILVNTLPGIAITYYVCLTVVHIIHS